MSGKANQRLRHGRLPREGDRSCCFPLGAGRAGAAHPGEGLLLCETFSLPVSPGFLQLPPRSCVLVSSFSSFSTVSHHSLQAPAAQTQSQGHNAQGLCREGICARLLASSVPASVLLCPHQPHLGG